MKTLQIEIPEKEYYDTDIILGIMKENQIAFKGKNGEDLVMPLGYKRLGLEANEKIFNLAFDSIRNSLVKQGILLEKGKLVKIKCLKCKKEKKVKYKYRHMKFCSLGCSSSYNTKNLHKEGRIKVDRDDKSGRFAKGVQPVK